jgi:PEP-CTERM motif
MRGGFFIVDVVMAGIGRVALRALLFALAAFAVANPASAEVLTYTFDPFTHFTFEDLDSAVLTGTFTINPPSDGLFTDDIVVAGTGQEAGTYEPEESGDNVLLYVDSATSNDLFLRFNENLGAAHLQLTQVDWHDGAVSSNAIEVGGGAQLPAAVPEPSTWAMMLLGFVGLGYAAVRRKGSLHRTAA